MMKSDQDIELCPNCDRTLRIYYKRVDLGEIYKSCYNCGEIVWVVPEKSLKLYQKFGKND